MARSQDEKDAMAKIEEAMVELLQAKGYGEGLLIDWMLVTAQHIVENDGSSTGIAVHTSAEQPIYRTNGLANYAVIKTEKLITS